jgi:calcium-dependent protein kinase
MFEYFEDERRFYIIQSLSQGGELYDEMQKRGKFNERDSAVILKQILSCLNYCHAAGIAHRDIKPENILLEDPKRFDQIKIVEWGTAAQFTTKAPNFYEKVGTPYYIAPEVLKENYTSKCDTWSVGVIAYVLLSTNPPF